MPDKLTDSEKKKIKQENKAKANPALAAGKKEKSDAKRERRKVRGMPSHAAKQPTPSHAACHAPCGAHAWPHTTCTCYVPLRSRRPSLPAVPRPHPSSAPPPPPPPPPPLPRVRSGRSRAPPSPSLKLVRTWSWNHSVTKSESTLTL